MSRQGRLCSRMLCPSRRCSTQKALGPVGHCMTGQECPLLCSAAGCEHGCVLQACRKLAEINGPCCARCSSWNWPWTPGVSRPGAP